MYLKFSSLSKQIQHKLHIQPTTIMNKNRNMNEMVLLFLFLPLILDTTNTEDFLYGSGNGKVFLVMGIYFIFYFNE